MTFKIILSGKLKYQLLTDDGFRYKRKCKPRGPNFLTYYKCVLDTCTAAAATVGGPDMDQIRLKYPISLTITLATKAQMRLMKFFISTEKWLGKSLRNQLRLSLKRY